EPLRHRAVVDLLLEPVGQLTLQLAAVVAECLHDRGHVLPVEHLVARHYFLFWTNWKPKRPLTQRLPRVTSWSSGEVTFTIASSCTWSVRLQPTPQYGHTVSTCDCCASSHV